jgi:predicted nucleic acid-binding protein
MTDKLAFIDSNILVYLIEENLPKRKKVAYLLLPDFIISTQVVAENINPLKFPLSQY